MKLLTVLVIILASVFVYKKNKEVTKLRNEVYALKSERPDLWQQSCYRAVNQACYWADCAVTPIETMESKICDRLPEDL